MTDTDESDMMENIGSDVVQFASEHVPERRRTDPDGAESGSLEDILEIDTWYQNIGYIAAGKLLIENGNVQTSESAVLSAFDESAWNEACGTFVNSVNDEVQENDDIEGIVFYPDEEVVAITSAAANRLGLTDILGTFVLFTGQTVLLLFKSCRRFQNAFGGPTCAALSS